jgi:hypothetical protein
MTRRRGTRGRSADPQETAYLHESHQFLRLLAGELGGFHESHPVKGLPLFRAVLLVPSLLHIPPGVLAGMLCQAAPGNTTHGGRRIGVRPVFADRCAGHSPSGSCRSRGFDHRRAPCSGSRWTARYLARPTEEKGQRRTLVTCLLLIRVTATNTMTAREADKE